MILNHVESFYVLLLRFRSDDNENEGRPTPMQGRPPTARPAARGSQLRPWPPAMGRPTTAKAPYRGSRLRAWMAPVAVAHVGIGSARGQGCSLQGRPLLQGSACARWHRPSARCHPRVAAPAIGMATHADGRAAATTVAL
ncbi:hypothetical protein GW17_00061437 [Ensete ventricosum]|nr:hypothetical protein GW17_00061437 [Ensete ventricosum]